MSIRATAHLTAPVIRAANFSSRHPAGNQFVEYFGEALFRADLCNADVAMGDLLIHEGAPCIAQQHAAKCLMPIKPTSF